MEAGHFFFVTFIILVIGFVSAEKKKTDTTVTGDITREKATGTRVDLGLSHQLGKLGVDGSVFGTSRGHRGGSLGISHKSKNSEFGGSVFGDNRGNRGGNLGISHKSKNLEFEGSVFGDNRGNRGGKLGISHKSKNLEFGGSVFGDNRGNRGGKLGISHKSKNLEFGGSVFGDNRGNIGAGVGLKWRFRRSTQLNDERFEVVVVANQCDFDVYDYNEDKVITKNEMKKVFVDTPSDAERLFNYLDTSEDGEITESEFNEIAPKKIHGC